MTAKYKYECCNCKKVYLPNQVFYLCPECDKKNKPGQPPLGILKTIYTNRKPEIETAYSPSDGIICFDELKLDQFIDILPIESFSSYPILKIGETPLYKIDHVDKKSLNHRLFLKDDSQNPTYSFKDRASALVSAYAKENGFDTIVAASTGNAGSSLAGICASQGQNAIIIAPESAPIAKLTQIIMYGAKLIPVKGTYDDAFDLSILASKAFGWYNRNTAYNPLTIEGKKTVSFEIFKQLDFSIPDRIFVPVGDGAIISGVYKGFEDLLNFGIIDRIPIIVAAQAKGSDSLIRNLNSGLFQIIIGNTIADSISVDVPRNFYMARDYILKYKGEIVSISDPEILEASSILSKSTGLFAEPAAATAFAGYLNYTREHKIDENSDNIVLITGSGLKDIKSLDKLIKIPASIYPKLEDLEKLINN
jgi:threonine synthase